MMVFIMMVLVMITTTYLQNDRRVRMRMVMVAMMMDGSHDNDFGSPMIIVMVVIGHRQLTAG
jgi:hypothetical protein